MKRLLILFLCLGCLVVFASCERVPLSISIIDMNVANSPDATFLVSYSQEKLYEEKETDLLVKSEKDNATIKIRKELEGFTEITIPEKDKWYSLTTLLVTARGQPDTEEFVTYKDAVNATWIVNSTVVTRLYIKAVVGDAEDNASGEGSILANKLDASKEFEFNIPAKVEE